MVSLEVRKIIDQAFYLYKQLFTQLIMHVCMAYSLLLEAEWYCCMCTRAAMNVMLMLVL